MSEMSLRKSGSFFSSRPALISRFGSMEVGEAVYLLGLFVFYTQAFLDTTMIAYVIPQETIPVLKAVAFAFVAIKIALTDYSHSSVFRGFIVLLIVFASVLTNRIGGYAAPLQFLIMVIGAKGVNFDRIARLFLWSSVVLTLVTISSALSGAVENVVVPRRGGAVYSYGFYYSTEFSAHVLSISIAWLYVFRNELSARVYLPALLWSGITFYLTNGRLSFYLTLVIVFLVLIADHRSKKKKEEYRYPRILKFSFAMAALVSIALMIFYKGGGFWGSINGLLTDRLFYAHEGYIRYGLTLFGQQIQMTGWGGGRTVWAENYFYIDNSYVNILIRFGAVTFLAALAISSLPYARLRDSSGVVAVLISAVAVASFVNEHLMGLSYNLFALMAFASSSDFIAAKKDSIVHSRGKNQGAPNGR